MRLTAAQAGAVSSPTGPAGPQLDEPSRAGGRNMVINSPSEIKTR